ncbi:MAG: hypothetical protein IPJ31_01950 [Bacteroidetes bacterium]|nr:hypothetical protein [Bacteroidota bacterium]MBP6314283.1 hypothetical protein [Chitinophagaceae bacterium]
MRLLIAVLFVFGFYNSYADAARDSIHLSVQYRDTIGTYIQIFIKDSVTLEELPNQIAFEFTDSSGKSQKYTRVLNINNFPEISNFVSGNFSIRTQLYIYKNIAIRRNKVNILTILYPRPSLQFKYLNGGQAPVVNQALVSKRYCEENCTLLQNCNTVQIYPAGDYKVEINTIPKSVFFIELFFGDRYEIQIPKPCNFIVSNLTGIDSVKLYYQKQDSWYLCKEIDRVYRNEDALLLQPGPYLLVWKKHDVVYEKKIYVPENRNYYCLFDEWD